MRKLIGTLFLGALLSLSFAVPASAHNYDNTSAFLCGAHRSFGYDELWHSKPIYLNANTLIEACKANSPTTGTYTFDVWYSLSTHESVGTNYADCSTDVCESYPDF